MSDVSVMKRYGGLIVRGRSVLYAWLGVLFLLSGTARSEMATVALLVQQTPNQGGFINPTPGIYQFDPNSEITLTAVPKQGYQFVYWLGDVSDPTSSTTIAYLDKPKIIVAIFQPTQFDSPVAGESSGSGRRSSSGGGFARGSRNNSIVWSGGGSSISSTAQRAVSRPVVTTTEGDTPFIPDPPIPEPATIALLGLGGLGLLRIRKGS